MGKRVVVGLSGGVDSSVAAYLLKQQGYDVIGVNMQMWQPDGAKNTGTEDAARVAKQLKIPFERLDFSEEFRNTVVDYFVQEYLSGRTPNPCIACNRHVKWEALLERASTLGAEYIATGHYARIQRQKNGRYAICRSKSEGKDQTYVLYRLTQEQLKRTLMPLGDYEKDEIRRIAATIGLFVADKKDSQEICFIPDHDYARFLQDYSGLAACPGDFVNEAGEVLGQHAGIIYYTVGQRKGLGAFGKPVFVKEIRPRTNEVVLGDANDVFSTELTCNQINCMAVEQFTEGMQLRAKIRYAHKGADCRIQSVREDMLTVSFPEPQRAVTPGQAVVFYDGDMVVGGGTIVANELQR